MLFHTQTTQGRLKMDILHISGANQILAALLSHGFVGLGIGAIIAGCALGFTLQVALAAPSVERDGFNERETCSESLNALVSYLEETAQIEGRSLRVERKIEGTILLHYEDFLQHMQCLGGELHIDTRDPPPTMVGN